MMTLRAFLCSNIYQNKSCFNKIIPAIAQGETWYPNASLALGY